MSGICGQFNLDNAPATETDLRAMTAMLKKRGPERTGLWHNGRDGPTGLGHTLLGTTPELLFERQPFEHAETGCVITADVRLDNRVELLTALDLTDRCESIGDAELILMTYLAWGEKCLDRLLGDFAFAIHDPRHQALFCARDHFGMRPLYYCHVPRRHFLFASDARAILVLPQVPYRINKGRVADFLVPQLEWIDYTSTFFEDVYRLPPGHMAMVTPAGLDVLEYWKPQPGPELARVSDEDYAQGFLEVFSRSVEARLRTPPGSVGSMLSGGMDSGSVVAVAKEILGARGGGPLRTFSAVRRQDTDDTDCAESTAIHAALSMPSISPTLIHPDALEDTVEHMASGHEEPFDGQFMLLKAIYLAAQNLGTRVVLDGGGGDIVLSEGSYIARLVRHGHFKLAMAEIAGERKFWGGEPIALTLLRYARAAFVPEAIKKRLRGIRYSHSVKGFLASSLISRDFATSIDIKDRFERNRQTFPGGWTPDYAVERSNAIRPNVTAGRERYARIAAATGAEARDPFMDKRVIDYCTRLPERFRLKNGWPKMILRQLMSGKLPDEVLWCRGKPHLGWLFNDAVTKRATDQGDLDLTVLGEVLTDYVDSAALASAWQTFHEGGDAEQIHSAHILSVWLQEVAQRPVVPN
jgi:asparagine synthase (glutamine-hydrolysing)